MVLLELVSVTEDAQCCQPWGRSQGSRASLSGGRLPSRSYAPSGLPPETLACQLCCRCSEFLQTPLWTPVARPTVHSDGHIWARGVTLQQDLPRSLKVGNGRNCLPQQSFLRHPLFHLFGGVLRTTDRKPQHGDAFRLAVLWPQRQRCCQSHPAFALG